MNQKSLNDIPAKHLAVRPPEAVFYSPENEKYYAHWLKYENGKWYVSIRIASIQTAIMWEELDEDEIPYLEDMIFLPNPRIDWQPETQFIEKTTGLQRRINGEIAECYISHEKTWQRSALSPEKIITHPDIFPLNIFKRKNSSSKTENDVDNWL